MYLLDTNHCSYLIDGQPDVVAALRSKGSAPVTTTVIVQGELLFMAHNSEQLLANLRRVQALLQRVRLYPIDPETAEIYSELKAALFARFGPKEKSKRRRFTLSQLGVSDNDLWIAAVALRHDLILVSADTDFARLQQVRTLKIENWLAPAV